MLLKQSKTISEQHLNMVINLVNILIGVTA